MRKFFSVWLILLVIIAFAAALFVSYPILTSSGEQTAQNDLNVLLDAAFLRISLARTSAETVTESANTNVLSKARAIDRFLSHDDALLETDALVALCEMLHVSAIDVTDQDGAITASSVGARIGRNLPEDTKTKWVKEALDGENLSLTQTDSENSALIAGCVSRTDTGGLIFIQSLDVAIMEAATAATPEQVLLDMSFIKDTLAVAETEGTDGPFLTGESYNVRRTENGVSLVASRALSQVYAVRSGVLLALVIGFLLCMLFAAVIQTMLIKKRLESRRGAVAVPAAAEDAAQGCIGAAAPAEDTDAGETNAAAGGEDRPDNALSLEADMNDSQKKMRRKPQKKRKKIFEFVEIEEPDAADTAAETGAPQEADAPGTDGDGAQAEAAEETKPVKKKPRRRRHAATPQEKAPEDQDADGDLAVAVVEEALEAPLEQEDTVVAEAAAEFAAPEAVLEEGVAEEEPVPNAARRRTHRSDAQAESVLEPPRMPRRKHRYEDAADADSAFDKIFD